MYDETIAKKGSNDVLSFIHYYIEKFVSPNVKILYLFSDNCASQNKNNTLVRFLVTLSHMGRFDSIFHRFPEPGHSFLPCDRYFGVIEKKKKLIERIFLPQEYMNLVKSASKKFHVIPVTQDIMYNYVEHLKLFFNSLPKAMSNEKFAISTYRVFKYTKNSNGVECSLSASTSFFTHFNMLKNNSTPNLTFMPKLYQGKLSLKHLKYENVMLLAKEYVGKNEMPFYESLTSDKPTSNPVDSDATESSPSDLD